MLSEMITDPRDIVEKCITFMCPMAELVTASDC